MPRLDRHQQTPPGIIAWADLTASPWLNGGGVTRLILSRALTASGGWIPGGDDWDWRLSIADVESAGAFSDFTGMTRILTVIEGAAISLTVDGVVEELERFRPFRFDGGAHTSAQLPRGPIRDLNVIARTGRVQADVRIEALTSSHPFTVEERQFCVLLAGHAQLRTKGETGAASGTESAETAGIELQLFDTAVGASSHSYALEGDGTLAIIIVSAAA